MSNPIQALLRWPFMHVEALFNRAFGDRINPLYHLGSISFLLFWIIGGSGLYLYIFFDTSVSGAYASVEAMTHQQWFAGGVMRSLHRYASDAMVITMLVHMLRYYAFDRLRGFRSFSWLTGVALIWGVFASGVNGFMLPWDRLAQYVTIASFEWLDWLPSFGGTLIRNFIVPSSVSDRLFSLLVFVHIGVPLLVLLLMWIHVQRVPNASLQPPRPIAIGMVLLLLALSLLQPVHSQGGAADLASAVTRLDLDWFLLWLFPLIDRWPLGWVWALVSLATLLLVVLPWLPPKRRRNAGNALQMTLHPGGTKIALRSGETLLEAGLRAGLALPYECRNGGCGVCLCSVHHGKVDHGHYQADALGAEMRQRGQALMCCATALEDVEIIVDVPSLIHSDAPSLRRWHGRVQQMTRLGPDVMRLMVTPPDQGIAFAAGQYLDIVLADGQRRAFSFASPPHGDGDGLIELHVALVPGGRFTTQVFESMQEGDTLELEGPFGHFTLTESTRPILFVAGATGFAPVKSILEDAFQRGIRRPMRLYWGARNIRDLYLLDLARQWQADHPHFEFVPVLSEPDPNWNGRTGLVHEAMLSDFPDLREHEIYVCGSLIMVEVAIPAFLAHGVSQNHCFSDAFTTQRPPQPPP